MRRILAVFVLLLLLVLCISGTAENAALKYEELLKGNWEQIVAYNTDNIDVSQSYYLFKQLSFPAEKMSVQIEGVDSQYDLYVIGDETGETYLILSCEGQYYYYAFGRIFLSQDGQHLLITEDNGSKYLYKKMK